MAIRQYKILTLWMAYFSITLLCVGCMSYTPETKYTNVQPQHIGVLDHGIIVTYKKNAMYSPYASSQRVRVNSGFNYNNIINDIKRSTPRSFSRHNIPSEYIDYSELGTPEQPVLQIESTRVSTNQYGVPQHILELNLTYKNQKLWSGGTDLVPELVDPKLSHALFSEDLDPIFKMTNDLCKEWTKLKLITVQPQPTQPSESR